MGGTKMGAEQNRLKGGCDLLVATPGRLHDHLKNTPGFRAHGARFLIFLNRIMW
jgi:ATP-dependent RNA helicase DDX18/HAS1